MLYFSVCPCTIGRSFPVVGRGKILTAFFWRAGNNLTYESVKYHSTIIFCTKIGGWVMFTCMNNQSVTQFRTKTGQTQMQENNIPTNSSSLLASWLIEPCLHIVLPVLFKMPIRDNIVVLHHFLPASKFKEWFYKNGARKILDTMKFTKWMHQKRIYMGPRGTTFKLAHKQRSISITA